MKHKINGYRAHYFFYYAAMGTFLPLFTVYLKDTLLFTNTQIGLITSTAAIVSIFAQMFWGMMTDVTKKPKTILFVLLLASMMMGSLFIFEKNFLLTYINYFIFSLFFGAVMPIFDALTVNYLKTYPDISYGQVRLLGSIGFSTMALLMSYLADHFGISLIFVAFTVLLSVALYTTTTLETVNIEKEGHFKEDLHSLLKIPDYLLLVLLMMILIGTNFGSQAYLSLFLMDKGQSVTMVGVMFFLMAIFEVPFMMYSRDIISKFGSAKILLFVVSLSFVRLLFMSFNLPVFLFIAITATQSAIIGLLLPTVIDYVASLVRASVFTTAVSLYIAASFGFSTWIMTLGAGYLSDRLSYSTMYAIYAYIGIAGILLAAFILKRSKLIHN